jgi:hypothetical protein
VPNYFLFLCKDKQNLFLLNKYHSFRYLLKKKMYGCYLTSDDDKFLDSITDELDKYNLSNDSSLCVSFYF